MKPKYFVERYQKFTLLVVLVNKQSHMTFKTWQSRLTASNFLKRSLPQHMVGLVQIKYTILTLIVFVNPVASN